MTYLYDANGNATRDGYRNNTITYNQLNLPATVTATNGNASYTYDANGRKLRSTVSGITTDYVDGIEWQDGQLNLIHMEEGRISKSGSNYVYEYMLKDHLGNTRSGFRSDATGTASLRSDYYPFGLQHPADLLPGSPTNRYLYNGKERQDNTGLYDYGARQYDPVIARFGTTDRFAEKYYDMAPYQYGANNPIVNIDVNGDSTWTTTRTVKDGANSVVYHTTHIQGKVLKSANSTVSAKDLAKSLNGRLNSQSSTNSITNSDGSTTTHVWNIQADYQAASSMYDVSGSDHLVVIVDNVTGTADQKLGGGPASGLGIVGGKVAYVEKGSGLARMTTLHFMRLDITWD